RARRRIGTDGNERHGGNLLHGCLRTQPAPLHRLPNPMTCETPEHRTQDVVSTCGPKVPPAGAKVKTGSRIPDGMRVSAPQACLQYAHRGHGTTEPGLARTCPTGVPGQRIPLIRSSHASTFSSFFRFHAPVPAGGMAGAR